MDEEEAWEGSMKSQYASKTLISDRFLIMVIDCLFVNREC